jgi:hypothetical protein
MASIPCFFVSCARRPRLRGFAVGVALASLGVAGAAEPLAQSSPQPTEMPAPPPAPVPVAAAKQSGAERRVKAAFLYKFLGYTEFPSRSFSDATSPVVIGVAGSDDMLAELARTVAGRTLNGRSITVKSVREGDSAPVHLLFVAGSDSAWTARMLRAASGPMLLVSECEDGLQYGSVINFTVVDERVRFDVSLDAAEKNNVRLSSRLLNVANHVQKGNI